MDRESSLTPESSATWAAMMLESLGKDRHFAALALKADIPGINPRTLKAAWMGAHSA
jgi:hypothetical protein